MKRLLSLALSAALLAALALPAAAAEEAAGASVNARLAKVTQAVKAALSLDTDEYESFHGGVDQDLVPVWNLEWQGEKRSLSIQALEDGTVAYFYRWEYAETAAGYWRNSLPTFPENSGAADRAAAEDFLSRVLRPGETVELKDREDSLSSGRADSSWEGAVSLNGLPSPLHWYITVENGRVTNFSRDVPEASLIGGVPSPEARADGAKAKADLDGTLKLRLEYVLAKPGDTKAVLRYVPENTHDFLADAGTGELLDLTELEEKLEKGYDTAAGGINGASPAAMTEAAADREDGGLTQAELEGAAELEGVLSKEELDKAVRAESAYGLRGYALISASYQGGEEQVLCSLRYARTDNGERLTRNVTVDARTGAVESVWSSAPYGREKKVTEEDALKKAEAFCKTWRPDRELVLYQADSGVMPWRTDSRPYWHFTFVQKVNGLPFRGNAVHVGVDASDGSVYSLSYSWDEDVTFDSANGTISMEAALSAWAGSYEAVLAYRRVPQKLTTADPVQAKLMERGAEYYPALRLTYGLEREESCEGVDAKTGALARQERGNARQPLAYTDLAGSEEKADIEKLAKYGAGYASEKFRPGKTLTQWELVALVYSLQGSALDPDARDADDRDSEYYYAYRLGLLTAAERSDNAVLTRGQVVKMLLNAAGYGPAARLEGIFSSDLRDFENQAAAERGYAAIAQALNLVSGSYAGSRSATRGEAASMLCRVLEREL